MLEASIFGGAYWTVEKEVKQKTLQLRKEYNRALRGA